ncbi:ABC transporter substrate-binding protein [Micromonospora sp. KC207]|uniref:ABC transporter substrate-binding protein n=1 Tax=Micromonospora sp. KC207 TaxID=2530377 RepID=UPI001FB74911|nr:extracellular solute-binding protein [Micromonospora sp. KC207]
MPPPSMRKPRRSAMRLLASALILSATSASLLACGDDRADDEATLTVWSLEDVTDRVTATKAIIADFTARTGTKVDLVTVAEDRFPALIATSAAAGELPDVVGSVSLAGVRTLAGNELLHPSANGEIVDALGRQTFSPRALELTADGGRQLAVPSDGWGQLLVYRKDLFAAAGLPAPDTYAKIAAAAARLNTGGVAGVTAATAEGDVFTQQTFEHLALANNCQLTDGAGAVTLDSPECVEAFRFYGDLIRTASVPGAQDVDTTRATYFAGRAAMLIWSPFILDELAGLRHDARPTCPQCRADPTFLARNSGFVTAITGPNATGPAQYGEISSWAVLDGAADPAASLVRYLLDDAYPRWFGMSHEGRFPVRRGTPAEPEKFLTAWNGSPAGVDRRRPLAEVYGDDVLAALRRSPDTFGRWGLTQGQGELVGAMLGELPVPEALAGVLSGRSEPAAARRAREDVEAIKAGVN